MFGTRSPWRTRANADATTKPAIKLDVNFLPTIFVTAILNRCGGISAHERCHPELVFIIATPILQLYSEISKSLLVESANPDVSWPKFSSSQWTVRQKGNVLRLGGLITSRLNFCHNFLVISLPISSTGYGITFRCSHSLLLVKTTSFASSSIHFTITELKILFAPEAWCTSLSHQTLDLARSPR